MSLQEVQQSDTRTDGDILINNGIDLSKLLMISRMNLLLEG